MAASTFNTGKKGEGQNIPDADLKNKGKKSFASLFTDNRVPDDASMLQYIAPPDGEIIIPPDEIESVESIHGHCLVGFVYGTRPKPYVLVNFLKGWGSNIKFFFKENGWIKFQFNSETEKDKVLNGGPYMILGRQLFLRELKSCFLYSKEDMMLLPMWVQISGLPTECWTAKSLSRIASVIGKPLHTDKMTSSKKGTNYVRVLVELDATKPPIWEQIVALPSGISISVNFKYELDPKYCDKCNSLGHVSEMCGVKVATNWYKKKRPVNRNNEGQPSNDMNSEAQETRPTIDTHMHEVQAEHSMDCTNDIAQPDTNKARLAQPEDVAAAQIMENQQVTLETEQIKEGQVHDSVPNQHIYFEDNNSVHSYASEPCAVGSDVDDLGSASADEIISSVVSQDRDAWKTVNKKQKRFNNKKKEGSSILRRSSRAVRRPARSFDFI